jgi:hypothetical protein
VNERAYDLASSMSAHLASLPGASSISFHAQQGWALALVIVASDDAVISLGAELGLSLDIRTAKGSTRAGDQWWRIAIGERERGALRFEVVGPRHRGAPPIEHTEIVTPELVLEAMRAPGLPTFDTNSGERLVLLASLGLDLGREDVRAALLELHHRGEIRMVRISAPGFVRTDLGPQGLRFELVEESALRDGDAVFHAVVLA